MTRRRRQAWSLCLAVLAACSAWAQDVVAPEEAAERQPRTGSDWIDARLHDMDDYAARYREAFIDEIVRYHEAPRALVGEALADDAMTAGDVYFACALAQATGRSCRTVIEAWRGDPAAGWEAVAGQLGVEPGDGVLRRIRGDITGSYARWARPLAPAAAPSKK